MQIRANLARPLGCAAGFLRGALALETLPLQKRRAGSVRFYFVWPQKPCPVCSPLMGFGVVVVLWRDKQDGDAGRVWGHLRVGPQEGRFWAKFCHPRSCAHLPSGDGAVLAPNPLQGTRGLQGTHSPVQCCRIGAWVPARFLQPWHWDLPFCPLTGLGVYMTHCGFLCCLTVTLRITVVSS